MRIFALILAVLLLTGCQVVPLEEQPAPESQQSVNSAVSSEKEESSERGEPVVLIALGQISVAAVDYKPDAAGGPMLTLELKNGTDYDLVFCIEHAKSNGVMCDPYWSCLVSAGETVESDVCWSVEFLEKTGILALNDLTLDMTICRSDDESVVLFSDLVTLTLMTKEETVIRQPVWDDCSVQVLAEKEYFSISAVGCNQENTPVLTLLLENRSEYDLLCTVTDVTVNGAPLDPQWGAIVMENAVLYSDIVMDSGTPVRDITMTLLVYNHDDWSEETLFDETVSIHMIP